MLIIGERINSTRKSVYDAIKNRNVSFINKEAANQLKGGADYLDINCAVTSGDEVQDMDWIVSVIQSHHRDINICIDSPNYLAIDRALKVFKGTGSVMINSITGEESRIRNILPLAVKYKAKLIALTMDGHGMPRTANERADVAGKIMERLKRDGFDPANLYFDPLIRPIATEPAQTNEVLQSIPLIKQLGPVKTVCGLSNVSFGLPNRSAINATFLSMAIRAGLDAVILDPMDRSIISALKASKALLGMDEFCADYIKAFRAGKI